MSCADNNVCSCGCAGAAPLISLSDVTMRREDRIVLDNISLDVRKGDFLAITGPNGGGKTTLLRIILGLLKPTRGTVSYCVGSEGGSMPSFGYLPQKNTIDSHFPLSVEEVIASGLLMEKGMDKARKAELVESTLELVGLQDLKDRPIGKISGGQLQRTLLGRAIIRRPGILVLDEPLSYIDKHFEERLYEIIDTLSKNATILLVSHEMSAVAAMANRHIIVDRQLFECSAHHHYFSPECDCPDSAGCHSEK